MYYNKHIKINIRCSSGNIEDIITFLNGGHNQCIDFNKVYPEPEGSQSNYNWRIDSWGTADNALNPSIETDCIRFETSDIPIFFLEGLSGLFPNHVIVVTLEKNRIESFTAILQAGEVVSFKKSNKERSEELDKLFQEERLKERSPCKVLTKEDADKLEVGDFIALYQYSPQYQERYLSIGKVIYNDQITYEVSIYISHELLRDFTGNNPVMKMIIESESEPYTERFNCFGKNGWDPIYPSVEEGDVPGFLRDLIGKYEFRLFHYQGETLDPNRRCWKLTKEEVEKHLVIQLI